MKDQMDDIPPSSTEKPTTPDMNPNQTSNADSFPDLDSTTQAPTPQAPAQSLPNAVYTQKKYTGLNIVLVLFTIVALLIWAGVGFLYFDNKRLKQVVDTEMNPSPTVTPTINPNKVSQEQIKIVAGNVVRTINTDENKILINKEEFPLTGLAGFARATVSPDGTKVCAESLSPSAKPGIYFYDLTTAETKEISPIKEKCLWNNESSILIYETTAPDSTAKDIYFYNVTNSEEVNVTMEYSQDGEIRRYSVDRIENNLLSCTIEMFDDVTKQKTGEKKCSINISNKEFKEESES